MLANQESEISDITKQRRLPVGAEVIEGRGVHFRLWAPSRKKASIVLEECTAEGRYRPLKEIELTGEPGGYFSALVSEAKAGGLYRYRLDGSSHLHPDPASRFQPYGPHGASQIIDPSLYKWNDTGWTGVSMKNAILYEMHIGTFTPEGNYLSAAKEFDSLFDLGVRVLEVMPVAEFPGSFGWGYDGVDMFAPTRLYGKPDDLRQFVDLAHQSGLAVILDVVYNHLGPDGNYLREFTQDYFTKKYDNEWGDAINFDGKNSRGVREFFSSNASYWIDEFHMDGLRLDATQQIFDSSEENILSVITKNVRRAAKGRTTIIVAENEPQHVKMVKSYDKGGYGMDAIWNDDFHHTAHTVLTGRREAYYTDYIGTPQEFVSAIKYGCLYQGQWYKWQKKRRGTPALDVRPSAFVNFLENHDQIANTARGLRIHNYSSPGCYRALTALILLAPATPMLFQGQEFASSSPFLYFADHNPELSKLVKDGREDFLSQFTSIATDEVRRQLKNPSDPSTFRQCKLDHTEREKHKEIYELHRDLLTIRREDETLCLSRDTRRYDGAVLSDRAFLIRFFGDDGDDRLLLVNLGSDLNLNPAPEPLLAPSEGRAWKTLWSSESIKYGGTGAIEPDTPEDNWIIPGMAAMLLTVKLIN